MVLASEYLLVIPGRMPRRDLMIPSEPFLVPLHISRGILHRPMYYHR